MNKSVLFLCLWAAAQAGNAATNCRFVTGGGVAFGPYDILSPAPTDTALDLLVDCTRNGGAKTVSVTVTIGPGANGTGIRDRRMTHSGGKPDSLSYGLYTDVGRSAIWGFTPGVDAVSQVINVPNNDSASARFTVYARLPAGQDVAAGSYGDRVQIGLDP